MQNLGISNLSILCREVEFFLRKSGGLDKFMCQDFLTITALFRPAGRQTLCVLGGSYKKNQIISGNTPDQFCRVNKTLLDLLFFFLNSQI